MSKIKYMEEIQDRIDRLHQSIPPSMAGHRKDKCDVCYLVNNYESLKARNAELVRKLRIMTDALDATRVVLPEREKESATELVELSRAAVANEKDKADG